MFTPSSISNGLELWPLNHTQIYENSQWKVLKNIKLTNWTIVFLKNCF